MKKGIIFEPVPYSPFIVDWEIPEIIGIEMRTVYKIGDLVNHANRSAKLIDAEQSGLPCACCGRFDHDISLLAKIQYLDDNSVVLVEFSSLKGNNEN